MNADNTTPRPWLAHGCVIESASRCVATTRGGIARADWQDDCPDARLIVRAVNSHAALVEALEGLDRILQRAESNASGNPEWNYVSEKINAARAALAAAKEPA